MDIIAVLTWTAFALAAMFLIRFVFESLAVMTLAIAMGMGRNDGRDVTNINLGAKPLWWATASAIAGIVLLYIT